MAFESLSSVPASAGMGFPCHEILLYWPRQKSDDILVGIPAEIQNIIKSSQ